MSSRAPEKLRDAGRSREAILAAAEWHFAERGYEGTSLQEIAAAAGLSRGTPSYFFGSKEELYRSVIERSFAERERATRAAFQPVLEWCGGLGGPGELGAALASAAEGYMGFLTRRPSFVKLVMRDELAGGGSVRRRRAASTAMADAFGAVLAVAEDRGLRRFAVEDAVLLFIALTFAPVSYSNTWMRAARRDLSKRTDRRHQVQLVVGQLMHLLAG